MKATCIAIIALIVIAICAITVPFIGFGKSNDLVVVDAAAAYGIEQDEYSIQFVNSLKDKQGNSAYGLYTYERKDGQVFHKIQIRNTISRPMMVATIFHEFAHAAQVKYKLDIGELTVEQHAEVLSFSVMRQSGYTWESIHLLPSHLIAKPKEYRATSQLWNIAFTGNGAMSVAQYTQN